MRRIILFGSRYGLPAGYDGTLCLYAGKRSAEAFYAENGQSIVEEAAGVAANAALYQAKDAWSEYVVARPEEASATVGLTGSARQRAKDAFLVWALNRYKRDFAGCLATARHEQAVRLVAETRRRDLLLNPPPVGADPQIVPSPFNIKPPDYESPQGR